MVEAKVKDLQIQPLKGGSPLKLTQAWMNQAGLETVDGRVKDHFLVAVSEEPDSEGFHNFFTQRTQIDPDKNLFVAGTPRLSLVRPNIKYEKLVLSFDGRDPVFDPGQEADDLDKIIPVQVWEYRGGAIEVPLLSEWLSDRLDRKVKVARTSGPWNRMARQNFVPNNNPLRAQDGYPVHALPFEDAEAVFNAINAPTDPNRFRYQVLLSGLPFRAIHDYGTVEINGVQVAQPKACDRCEVTGIDQERGEFSRIKPLAGIVKLGAPRWIRPDTGSKVHIMGENWLPQGESIITIGDTVRFLDQRETPLEFEEVKKNNIEYQ